MSKVIIGIHGLGNKPSKEVLEKWWKESIDEGLQKMSKPIRNYKFELVYWADILHEQPLETDCTDKNNPLFLKEKYIPSSGIFIPEDHSNRKKILDYLNKEIDSLFLNKDFTLNYSFVSDSIISHWFKDLEAYYTQNQIEGAHPHANELIRKRTKEIFQKYITDEILVIAHSMGSIIGYDVLAFDVPQINIDTFITIGSPLGVPVVKSKIAAERKLNHINTKHLPTPSTVQRRWYNFSDLEDKVAFNYKLSDDFGVNRKLVKPIDFVVNNDYEINGERNPHKSYGYLRTPEVASKIIEFLEYTQPARWEKWWKKVKRLKARINSLSRKDRNLRLP